MSTPRTPRVRASRARPLRRASHQAATAVVLAACVAGTARAQAPAAGAPPVPAALNVPAGRGDVRGTVLDASGNAPVARATIAVRRAEDSSLVAGAVATAQGAFRVQGLRPGRYRLRAAAVGYAPHVEELAIGEATGRVALPPIVLSRSAAALSGVQVSAERAALEVAADRNVYRPQALAPAATTAIDVLDAVPAVQVEADGGISLRGSASVAVQINGRPAPIRGPQLAEYLKSLPARVVDKVEVIPNPSAKNDPEGMAGIINIVLKQATDLGVSGGFTTTVGGADRRTAAGNVGYQEGPWTSFLSYGYTADAHAPNGSTERALYGSGGRLLAASAQDVAGDNRVAGHNLSGTVDRKLGARDVVSTALAAGWRSTGAQWSNAFSTLAGASTPQDAFVRSRDAASHGTTVDATTTLRHAFGAAFNPRQPHEISAEVRFTRNRDRDALDLADAPRAAATAAATQVGPARTNLETNDTDLRQHAFTAQADYTHALTARRKLEAGVKHEARQIDRDFRDARDAAGTGAWTPGALGNALVFDERIDAVYGVYSDGVGRFDLQAGLRGEQARRDLALGGAGAPRDYGSLFPSASVVFNQSDATTLKLSYDRRINRPGAAELNPFPTYTDNQNVVLGNPGLTPEYVNALEAGITRSGPQGTVELSPFYRNSTHDIRTVANPSEVLEGRQVTTISYRNLAHNVSWGTDLNATRKLGSRVNLLAAGTLFRMVTSDAGNSGYGSDATVLITRVNATAQVTPTLAVQGGYFYRSPINVEGGRFLSTQAANFSVRQALPGGRGTVSLRAVDPFNTSRFLVQVAGGGVTQRSFRRQDMRAVYLGYGYNFGRAPKVRVLRPDAGAPTPFGG